MDFMVAQAGEYPAKIAEPKTTMDIRKLSLTNFADLIAY